MTATTTIPEASATAMPMPRDTSQRYVSAARHSRRVRRLKFALPILAGIAVIGFGSYSWLRTLGLPTLDLANASIVDGKLVMANPKLDGFNNENEPYSLKALRAIQDIGLNHMVRLEAVDARMPLGPGRYADVKSPVGNFDNAAYTMTFNDPLSVVISDGTSATLADAHVEMNTGNIVTRGSVDVASKGMHILAEGLTVTERGKTLTFMAKVRMKLDPQSLNLAQDTTGDIHADSQ